MSWKAEATILNKICNIKTGTNIEPFTSIKRKSISLKGLSLALENNYFTLNGNYFKQSAGLTKGWCLCVN